MRLYNAVADGVMLAAVARGARMATEDLYLYVVERCGGQPGYAQCPGFQLPFNVHFSATGFAALAAEVQRATLAAFG